MSANNSRGRRFTILSVAYPLLPVSSGAAGGAEQVLFLLERELVAAGHRSLVIAAAGSCVSGELFETPAAPPEITDEIRADAQRLHAEAIERAIEQESIDVIHFHGLDFWAYLPHGTVARLATLHLPITWYPQAIFDDQTLQLNCVSKSQARSAETHKHLPVIENGIDTAQYGGKREKQNYLLWIGRICPEKGPHVALHVAQQVDMPLQIAGPVHPFAYHRRYFHEQIQPLLDERRQYVGPIDLEKKSDLLGSARCLLVPSSVAETSSLVAMEALASGTPVVAFRCGALPEIVEHGRTGFIVDSEEEMVEAVRQINAISPDLCRATARERFDVHQMRNGYLELYCQIMERSPSRIGV